MVETYQLHTVYFVAVGIVPLLRIAYTKQSLFLEALMIFCTAVGRHLVRELKIMWALACQMILLKDIKIKSFGPRHRY